MSIENEISRRENLWNEMLQMNSAKRITPTILRELRVYSGAAGIWKDTQTTREYDEDGNGITVSVLHTGYFSSEKPCLTMRLFCFISNHIYSSISKKRTQKWRTHFQFHFFNSIISTHSYTTGVRGMDIRFAHIVILFFVIF